MLFLIGFFAGLVLTQAHLDGPLESYSQGELIGEIQNLRRQSLYNPFITSNSAQCCPAGQIAVCKKCEPSSCGINADCWIMSDQITCTCRNGYTGNPKTGCKKSSDCTGSGDPHYRTLDGSFYDYMGTCPHIYSQPCQKTDSPAYYVVKAKNKKYNPKSAVSYVGEVEVVMHDQVIHIDSAVNLVVNGKKTYYPYYYPSKADQKVSVVLKGRYAHVKNVDGVQVVFGNEYINLKVPQIDEFMGRDGLCGFAGNLNNNCTDDLIGADGVGLIQANCRYPKDKATLAKIAKVLDTWRTNDFTGWNPAGTGCETGEVLVPQLPDCDTRNSARECLPIQQAATGQGPFAACKILGAEKIQQLYESCTFDGCYIPGSKCVSFTNFVGQCQQVGGIINLPTWRTATGCGMNCPQIQPFSTYDACISGCQPTCGDRNVVQECNDGCHEGCKCNAGYILDPSSNPAKCVKADQCPCVDAKGESHPQGFSWLHDKCTQLSVCLQGTIYDREHECTANSSCGTEDQNEACVCNAGFKWNPGKTECIAA